MYRKWNSFNKYLSFVVCRGKKILRDLIFNSLRFNEFGYMINMYGFNI